MEPSAEADMEASAETATPDVDVERCPLTDAISIELITELNAELSAMYPEEGATHFRLDPDEVGPGRGAFVVAFDAASRGALGCGAVRVLEPGAVELKRMFVRREARGRRISWLLLNALEREAAALNVRRLVLETGVRQHEALGLYERAGFIRIEPFGEYVDSPLSVCMAKQLR